jgi:hypothetical protein
VQVTAAVAALAPAITAVPAASVAPDAASKGVETSTRPIIEFALLGV